MPPVHQRAGAGHVDADQPVGAGARQSGLVQRKRAVAGTQRGECLVDTGLIQRRQPQPLNRTAPAALFQNFAGDGFAFAIGVGGNHHCICLFQQLLDDAELLAHLRADHQPPCRGNKRQMLCPPVFQRRIVILRRGHAQQMAKAPGDGHGGVMQVAVAAVTGVKYAGNIARLRGFFAQVKLHGLSPVKGSSAWCAGGVRRQGKLEGEGKNCTLRRALSG